MLLFSFKNRELWEVAEGLLGIAISSALVPRNPLCAGLLAQLKAQHLWGI